MAEVISFELLNRIAGEEGFLWQFDYGQKMKFDGVELPASYTVHFANSSAGDSVPQIGDETGVSIPDQVLTSGKTVYFWLFLHPDANSGQTAYANMIKVHPRTALPTIEPPTPEEQSILDQLMAALEAGVTHVNGVASGMQQQIEDELSRAKASGEFKGDPGAVFTPEVDGQGILSWENNGGLPNPNPVDLTHILDLDAYEKKEDLAADIGKGQARGVAELDDAGKVPSSQLPSYVDDVVEYSSVSQFPVPGESGKIYVSTSNNHAYRWGGTRYFDLSAADVTGKADKRDTVLETTLSRGRVEGSTAGEASFAFGKSVTASGDSSHAEGFGTTASGDEAHAEGFLTVADGNLSHAEGYHTTTTGVNSHAEGNQTLAYGDNSHAEGYNTAARNTNAHAEGHSTNASGVNSHAEGYSTIALEVQAHAEGHYTTASGENSHAEGASTIASGHCSHAEGNTTSSSGQNSHAEGNQTKATGNGSHSEGYNTESRNDYSHAEGMDTIAVSTGSHAEGKGGSYNYQGTTYYSQAEGQFAHTEGLFTATNGTGAHAEGGYTRANAYCAHAEGEHSLASSATAHAEGYNTKASEYASHSEGYNTKASEYASHSEGYGTKASGYVSHAEGFETETVGAYSHVEGFGTKANGLSSHVRGRFNVPDSLANWDEWVAGTEYAVGDRVKITSNNSVVGYVCKTANADSTWTSSHWTYTNTWNYEEIVGNGTANNDRANIYALGWDGTGHFAGDVYVHCNPDSTGGIKIEPVTYMTLADAQAIINNYGVSA